MALTTPVPERTWRISTTVIGNSGNGSTDYQNFMYMLVRTLCCDTGITWTDMAGNSASAPPAWTVATSCGKNGGSFSYGNTNYWFGASGAQAYIITGSSGTGNRAHITLNCTNMFSGTAPQLMIDYLTASALYTQLIRGGETSGSPPTTSQYGGFYFSPAGSFANGSLTARPYSADEVQLYYSWGTNGSAYNMLGGLSSTTTWTGRLHVMRTTDGQSTRAFFYYNGVPIWYMILDVPGSPFGIAGSTPLWNYAGRPWIGTVYPGLTTTTNPLLWSTFIATAPFWTSISSNTNPTTNYKTFIWSTAPYDGYAGRYVHAVTSANAGDGGWPMCTVGLACLAAGYTQEDAGYLVDWKVLSTSLGEGDYTRDGTNGWVVIGDTLQPWNQSALQTI
jgi:hypothetical protein